MDIESAKKLVVGSDPGHPLRLLSSAVDPAAKALAAYIQSQAEKIGLTVELVEMPAAQFIAIAFDPEQQKEQDMSVGTMSYIDIPDPTYWAELVASSEGGFNGLAYRDNDVDSWIAEAKSPLDPDARAELMYTNNKITGANPMLNAHFYYPWARELGSAG